ncbi:hypothetical protein ABBQ32_003631 [Trebouxia sp. C0010 RCD-2024]
MQEKVYEGLSPNCNPGHQQVLHGKLEASIDNNEGMMMSDEELVQGSGSPHSGDSSRTYTVSLPTRRQQQRPCKKSKIVQAEAHSSPPQKQKGKQARNASEKTGSKPRSVAKASKAAKLHNKLPAVLKPLLKAEIEEDLMKIIRQTGSEENKIGNCRSNGKGRGGANKARQAKGGQDKLKGPCANCPHTVTVAWRRGAKGRAYAGQPLCNGCGMYASRHPRLSEAALKKAVADLRRAQGVCIQEEAMTATETVSDSVCRATAVGTAATAAASAVPTTSNVLRLQGSNDLVARVPAAEQSSGMQLLAEQQNADTAGRAGQSVGSMGAGVQRGESGVAKSRKRSAEASSAQPAAKRSAWKIEAFPGSLHGSDGHHNSSRTASVAGSEGSSHSREDGQEVAEGGRAPRRSFRAAKHRHYKRTEEAGHA